MSHWINYKIVFIFSCFTCILSIKGYSQFLNKDAKWTVRTVLYGEEAIENYHDIQIIRDSIINDTVYSIFDYQSTICALREESNKVYYKVLNKIEIYGAKEKLLYDFDLSLNDSIHFDIPLNYEYASRDWMVKMVDSVLVGGEYKRRILLEVLPDGYGIGVQAWIKDVGSTSGPLYFTGVSEHEWWVELDCYSVNNERLYGDCRVVGLSEIESDNNNLLFYDPQGKKLNCFLKQNDYVLNIYTIMGSKIYSKQLHGESVVDVGNFKSNFYLIEILTNDFSHCEKLFLK
jgi:hypothetical protein